MKFLSIVTLIALLSLNGCGGSSESSLESSDTVITFTNDKIIDGSEVSRTDSPQIVKINLFFPDGSQGLCSGTVIGDNDVLTAGHCFTTGLSAANIERPDGSTVAISSAIIHGGFSFNADVNAIFNDIAIARTSTAIGLPALGIIVSQPVAIGDTIGIWGYGLDEDQEAGTLKMGSMIVDDVTPNHIFSVFDDQSNTCNGDSGGPATLTLTDDTGNVRAVGVVGIVSSGSLTDCSQGDLSLFANVQGSSLKDFILRHVPEAVFL